VVTVTIAFSVRGYCSTGSDSTARTPSTRIIRLITVASTGRRMKMSVKFIGLLLARRRVGVVARLDGVVDHHRRAVTQLDLSGGHHRRAWLDAAQHRDLVAAG